MVVFPPSAEKNPSRLIQLLRKWKISRLVLVPSLLQMMLEAVQEFNFVGEEEREGGEGGEITTKPATNPHSLEGALPHLRMYFVGGEMLSRDLSLSFFQSTSPTCHLFNMYGSTETTADATFLECVRGGEEGEGKWGWMDEECKSVPVGGPVPNTIALVKIGDEGRVGELYMAGLSGFFSLIYSSGFSLILIFFSFILRSVAAGYLLHGKQVSTVSHGITDNNAFLPLPSRLFEGKRGGMSFDICGYDVKRMFRTGDLVRVFEERGGEGGLLLEFLGRKDNVIKLGGI